MEIISVKLLVYFMIDITNYKKSIFFQFEYIMTIINYINQIMLEHIMEKVILRRFI